ncbi:MULTISPECIES: cytochrome c [Ruegeria]|uniref:c-type cytochrome n=1 Tax=Ruegeria TaxID=97050 RepID=UPI00147D65E9|nr:MULTISPECIES: cytochrome c [Ruegeria]NOD35685.1 c-type cytochrome [Ruegeria sp. HKCCD7296]NOD75668.1 c-type cytochrome [Ruegeria sp. HKCCD4332]NOD89021.1 c-type cytochrome [Ruegeria sp. HKCCD4318]NOE14393.1 c-type cytochrome [Ruegeria sp. HKCCD4318-2]NOE36327.1 c-type cytochrome [Ruegeria sp. HKCCD7318]
MKKRYLTIGLCTVAAVAAFTTLRPGSIEEAAPQEPLEGDAMVAIQMPPIEGNAEIGQRVFEVSCASCHGVNAVGVEGAGPPLIHKIYEPSHHADEAFQRAVSQGVRSHHWQFGDMPPVEGLTRGDVAMVIAYIREIQRANGIN